MSELNVALTAVGGLVVVLGLLSGSIRRSLLSEPLVALLVGVLLGPAALGLLDPAGWGSQETVLEQAARLTLAISLMGVALRLPKREPFRGWRSLAVLLGLVMPFMWLVSGLLVYLIVGAPFLVALLVGAVVTPTDPVVSSTIVTGDLAEKNLPERLRHTLSGESGANDGLAYPFVLLPILLLTRPPGEALWHWLTRTLLWEVGAAVVFGVLVGYGAGRLLEWAHGRGTMERTSFLAYTLALSLAVLGAAKLVGTDGILAVFVAGLAFDAAVSESDRAEEERVQEAVNRFFILPIFVLLGLTIPWEGWMELGWAGLFLASAVLLLRRLPAVLALKPLLGRVRGTRDALFLGWFGPIGVAALFYATFSVGKAGVEEAWVIGSLIICASILVHGLSATPLTRLYGRHARNDGSGE
ncbi:MAG: cation:proton antiporter [Actinomycetota bacterium]|nr:cation:proton antiporter [Actinomycetota bacterium]